MKLKTRYLNILGFYYYTQFLLKEHIKNIVI